MTSTHIPGLLLVLWCTKLATSQQYTCSELGSARLNDAGYFDMDRRAGRVEICAPIASGGKGSSIAEWQTITVPTGSVSWRWKNALVACREIFPEDLGVMSPIVQDTLPYSVRAPSSQLVFGNVLTCDGTENRVFDCLRTPLTVTTHDRDAYIWCRSDPPNQGDIRLYGSRENDSVGVVEMYLGGLVGWVTVCRSYWGPTDATLACEQLGYESGEVAVFEISSFAGERFSPEADFGIFCTSADTHLSSCVLNDDVFCTTQSVRAGVRCTASDLPEGSIRLNPASNEAGDTSDQRVEVLYTGRWGSICDNDWDTIDGAVACNSLGLGSPTIDTTPNFESVLINQPIWLGSVLCEGSEESLALCERDYPVGYAPSCTHDDDAALACTGSGGLSAGAIISIVIAVVVAMAFIVPFAYFHGRKLFKSSRQRQLSQRITNNDAELDLGPEESVIALQARQRSESSSTDDSIRNPGPSRDTELTQGAPPSYREAVRLGSPVAVATADPPRYPAGDRRPDDSERSSLLPPYPLSAAATEAFLHGNGLEQSSLLPPYPLSAAAMEAHNLHGNGLEREVHHSDTHESSTPVVPMDNPTSTSLQVVEEDSEHQPDVSSHPDSN